MSRRAEWEQVQAGRLMAQVDTPDILYEKYESNIFFFEGMFVLVPIPSKTLIIQSPEA